MAAMMAAMMAEKTGTLTVWRIVSTKSPGDSVSTAGKTAVSTAVSTAVTMAV